MPLPPRIVLLMGLFRRHVRSLKGALHKLLYSLEEGLIQLGTSGFTPSTEGGGLYYKDHLLYYHQFLRRNFSSNLNSTFLAALARYYKNQ
jgi:hypothetical protein